MASSRATLERIGGRVPVPQPAFDRLMRRRARKQRNQRIATAVFALILAAAAIGGAIRVLGNAEHGVPANPGLDRSFGSAGMVTTSLSSGSDQLSEIAIEPDGKIVAAGYANSKAEFALVRYNPDGSLDRTFGGDGSVTTNFTSGSDFADGVAIQPDGKIVAAGTAGGGGKADFAVARYNPDGSLDTTFGDRGKLTTNFARRDDAWDVTVEPDGKIVAAGWGAGDFAVARYRPDGTLDPSFGTGGEVADIGGAAFGVTVGQDGKILLVGNTDDRFAFVRYNPDGTLDRSFGKNGLLTNSSIGWSPGASAVIQHDGKIVSAGGENPEPGFAVARFNPDGSPDPTFGTGGRIATDFGSNFASVSGSQVALEPDGNIVVAGSAAISASDSDFALARYLSSRPSAPTAGSSNASTVVVDLGLAALVAIVLLVRTRRRRVS